MVATLPKKPMIRTGATLDPTKSVKLANRDRRRVFVTLKTPSHKVDDLEAPYQGERMFPVWMKERILATEMRN